MVAVRGLKAVGEGGDNGCKRGGGFEGCLQTKCSFLNLYLDTYELH